MTEVKATRPCEARQGLASKCRRSSKTVGHCDLVDGLGNHAQPFIIRYHDAITVLHVQLKPRGSESAAQQIIINREVASGSGTSSFLAPVNAAIKPRQNEAAISECAP